MSLNKDRRETYEDLGAGDRKAVDRAFSATVLSLVENGINTKGNDAAENLVGAIARYIEDSREG